MSRRLRTGPRDAFAPVEWALLTLLFLIAGSVVLGLAAIGFDIARGGDGSDDLLTGDTACVVVDRSAVASFTDDPSARRGEEGIERFDRQVATLTAHQWRVCLREPSRAQWVAARVEPVGGGVLLVGGLCLALFVVRRSRAAGLFSPAAARVVTMLGSYLLACSLVGPIIGAAANGLVVAGATPSLSWGDQLVHSGISVPLVLLALGVLSFGRIIGRAVQLQNEVDLTV